MTKAGSEAPRGVEEAAEATATRAFSRARLALLLVALAIHWPGVGLGRFISVVPERGFVVLAIGALWAALVVLGHLRAVRSGAEGFAREGTKLPRETGLLLADTALLTGLLANAGAAENPFSLLYFAPIALSTLLEQRSTLLVALAAVSGFSVLLLRSAERHSGHDHFFQHILGMAVALAISVGLVTFFVHHIAGALSEKAARIRRLEEERKHAQTATTLGALAAGAAHELGTPLGTVQLLAEEIPLLPPEERNDLAREMSTQIRRMKEILHRMSSTEISQELLSRTPWALEELGLVAREFGAAVTVELGTSARTNQPRLVLEQITRELLKNATRAASNVELRVASEAERFVVSVKDDGPGVPAESREEAFRPFVSFSAGRGLGLFLARTHARQLGGELSLTASTPTGTVVSLDLPLLLTTDEEGSVS